MSQTVSGVLAMAKNEMASTETPVEGIVCPACYRPLKNKQVFGPGRHVSGMQLRHYYGHCYECATSCEVIQFERDGKWLMHRMRQFRIGGAVGQFVEVMPLPIKQSPILKTGPGGDYMNDITDAQLDHILQSCTELFNKLGKLLGECIDLKRKFRTTNGH
ncbi:MAG: hypothetical protein OEV87_13015 [Phycisphaerae bacterium]|nr:hypothetical protein [Phycisphaerae bacterium]